MTCVTCCADRLTVPRVLQLMAKKSMRFDWNSDVMRAVKRDEDAPASPVATKTDAEMRARCDALMNSITLTVYGYIRRGLFESDKLVVAALLCMRVRLGREALHA